MYLADINFWLAVAFESHVSHVKARIWFDNQSDDSVCFCRMTQQGFLRLATDRRIFKDDAVSLKEDWAMYDSLSADPRVASLKLEPVGIEVEWRRHTERATFSPKVWNDAYLAAFASVADFEVVTFDKSFAQYDRLKCNILM